MFHYDPSTEPDSERLLLVQMDRIDTADSHFAHPIAWVVRKAQPAHNNPDRESQLIYGDGVDATGYRCATWNNSGKAAVYVEDLFVHAQITLRNSDGTPSLATERRPYGCRVLFDNVHRVEERTATLMTKTFAKLSRAATKTNELYGYLTDDDFAGLCIRTANALGIKRFLFQRDPKQYRLDNPGNFIVTDAKMLNSYVEDMLRKAVG